MRRAPPTKKGSPSPSSVKKGERTARPLRDGGRIRRESITTKYRSERRAEPVEHTISPGDAFRKHRHGDKNPLYYVFLGFSAEDSDCMYFYQLGSHKVHGSVGYGLPDLIRRDVWLSDYRSGHSEYEPIPLEAAVDAAEY